MKSTILLLAGAVKAEGGCSIDTSVLEPRPFHKGFIFKGCNAQTDESNMVPNGTSCREVMCRQFKFSSVNDVTCIDGQWSALPNCFKGCPAPVSKAGYQFVQCRKNLGEGTSRDKGWYEDTDGAVFYPPGQRCRKVVCPSILGKKNSEIAKEQRESLMVEQERASTSDRFECNCDVDGSCFWLNFNDGDHGLSLNDDVDLSCAAWSEWSDGECTKKQRTRSRQCLQPNGDEGTEGVDCLGEAETKVACGRRGY